MSMKVSAIPSRKPQDVAFKSAACRCRQTHHVPVLPATATATFLARISPRGDDAVHAVAVLGKPVTSRFSMM